MDVVPLEVNQIRSTKRVQFPGIEEEKKPNKLITSSTNTSKNRNKH